MVDGTAFGGSTLSGLLLMDWVYRFGDVYITDAGRAALTEWRAGILDKAWRRTEEKAQQTAAPLSPESEHCHANRDGECDHKRCPQLRDNEPAKSGRSCPLSDWPEEGNV